MAVAMTAYPAVPGWVETPRNGTPMERYDGEGLEVAVKDQVIYISTDRAIDVKVFTILGQLISSETLGPGTHRLQVKSRGIYILKAGSVTRRITI